MNPKKNSVVTRGPWGFGNTSGSGIVGCVISATRHRTKDKGDTVPSGAYKIQKGQLDGHRVAVSDSDARYCICKKLGLLYGYLQWFGRNTGRTFVMSRAARKRGYKPERFTTNYLDLRHYNEEAKRGAAERIAEREARRKYLDEKYPKAK